MRKRGTIIVVLCCIALLMLIGICVLNSTRCDSSGTQVETQTGRGIITDRNGVVLVANDTISCPDSAGMVAVRIYPHPIAPQIIGCIEEATQADVDYGDGDYMEDTKRQPMCSFCWWTVDGALSTALEIKVVETHFNGTDEWRVDHFATATRI